MNKLKLLRTQWVTVIERRSEEAVRKQKAFSRVINREQFRFGCALKLKRNPCPQLTTGCRSFLDQLPI